MCLAVHTYIFVSHNLQDISSRDGCCTNQNKFYLIFMLHYMGLMAFLPENTKKHLVRLGLVL